MLLSNMSCDNAILTEEQELRLADRIDEFMRDVLEERSISALRRVSGRSLFGLFSSLRGFYPVRWVSVYLPCLRRVSRFRNRSHNGTSK